MDHPWPSGLYEILAVNLIEGPSYMMSYFLSVALNILFVFHQFEYNASWCGILWIFPIEVCGASWMCRFMSFIYLDCFWWFFSLIFFFFFASFLPGTPRICVLIHMMVYHRPFTPCSFFFFFVSFLVMPHGIQNPSSPTRDWTCTLCSGSMES